MERLKRFEYLEPAQSAILRAGCQEVVNGSVKFRRLLRHGKVTGLVQLQVLRAGYCPMDLHFIVRRGTRIVRSANQEQRWFESVDLVPDIELVDHTEITVLAHRAH